MSFSRRRVVNTGHSDQWRHLDYIIEGGGCLYIRNTPRGRAINGDNPQSYDRAHLNTAKKYRFEYL